MLRESGCDSCQHREVLGNAVLSSDSSGGDYGLQGAHEHLSEPVPGRRCSWTLSPLGLVTPYGTRRRSLMALPESSPLRAKSPDCLSSAMRTHRSPFPCLGLSFHVCRMDSLLLGPGVRTCLVWGAQQASSRGSLHPGTRGTTTYECRGHDVEGESLAAGATPPPQTCCSAPNWLSQSQALLRAGKRPELSASLSRGESLVLPHLTGPFLLQGAARG